jgi:hypothetical protein
LEFKMIGFRALVKRLTLSAPAPGSLAGRDVPTPGTRPSSAREPISNLAGKGGRAVSPLSFAHLFGVKPSKAPSRERGAADDRAQRERGDDALPTLRGNVDDDQEMQGDSLLARARGRERARCGAIMGSAEGQRNPVLAAHLAFKTRATRGEAIALLAGTAAGGWRDLHPDRAKKNPGIGAFAGSAPSRGASIGAGWDRAFAQANRPAVLRARPPWEGRTT